jgi:hypothetical protein
MLEIKINSINIASVMKQVEKEAARWVATQLALDAQTELRRITPIDTGKTRDGWKVTVERDPQGYVVAVENVNRSEVTIASIDQGSKPHVIEPRNARALAFNGVVRMKVNHPGTAPHYIFDQLEKWAEKRIDELYARYFDE